MSYNIVDLLNKAILVAEDRKRLYEKTKTEFDTCHQLKIIISVIIRNLTKTIDYYKKLREETSKVQLECIDFLIYDKISFLIDKFKSSIFMPENICVLNILKFCLAIEENSRAVFIDIQGRLIQNETDMKTNTYEILSKVIKHKEKNILELKTFIENYFSIKT